jgi:hypothetical protein
MEKGIMIPKLKGTNCQSGHDLGLGGHCCGAEVTNRVNILVMQYVFMQCLIKEDHGRLAMYKFSP